MLKIVVLLNVFKFKHTFLLPKQIFQNSTDFKETGSLMWAIDRTKTKFGSRLMKKWISQPLCNVKEIEERQDAVSEILKGEKKTNPSHISKVFCKNLTGNELFLNYRSVCFFALICPSHTKMQCISPCLYSLSDTV